MKKNFNVIQIKGIKGIIYLAFIGICLAVGFGWFPGWVCMQGWNYAATHFTHMPLIGILQGMLLWGILAASYFTFRKDRLVVCMKASDGLSEEELRAVFADMKKQVQHDKILQDMLKAQNAELRIKNFSETDIPGVNITEIKNLSQKNNNEQAEKIQSK